MGCLPQETEVSVYSYCASINLCDNGSIPLKQFHKSTQTSFLLKPSLFLWTKRVWLSYISTPWTSSLIDNYSQHLSNHSTKLIWHLGSIKIMKQTYFTKQSKNIIAFLQCFIKVFHSFFNVSFFPRGEIKPCFQNQPL